VLWTAGAQYAYERAVRFPRGLRRQVGSSGPPRGFRRQVGKDEALLLAAGLDPATQQSHPALVRSLLLQAEALRLKARGQQGAIVAELAKRTEASLRLLQPAEPRTEIAAAETMRTIAEQFAPPPPPPDRHDWHYC
jgi:hypothetical protein